MTSPPPDPSRPVPPGWYSDGGPRLRWWDGTQWTEHLTGAAPVAPAKTSFLPNWARAVLALAVIGVILSAWSLLAPKRPSSQAPLVAPVAPVVDDRETVFWSGDGAANSATAQMSGDYSISWQTTGDCYYGADLEPGFNSVFTASDALSGTGNLYGLDEAVYYVEVITGPAPQCGWAVTFTPQ